MLRGARRLLGPARGAPRPARLLLLRGTHGRGLQVATHAPLSEASAGLLRGVSLMQLGRLDDADVCFERTASLLEGGGGAQMHMPPSWEHANALGLLAFHRGEPLGARSVLEGALAQCEAHCSSGWAHDALVVRAQRPRPCALSRHDFSRSPAALAV